MLGVGMLGIIGSGTAGDRRCAAGENPLMWSRALAGSVSGFFLAAAVTGLMCWLVPGPWQHALLPSLLAFFPLWCLAATAAFIFTNSLRAWLGLGGAALTGFILLELIHTQGWVQ